MGLFDPNTPNTLADVLGQQASTATTNIQNQYAKRKRQEAAMAGATGRLNSGVQNYTTADTQASELGAIGGVQSGLAGALGAVPTADYLSQQGNQQNNALAQLIASLNKPSDLEQALSAFGLFGKAAGTVAAFA